MEVDTAEQSTALEMFLMNRQIEVLPLLTTQIVIADLPVDLYGIRLGQTYRNNWIFLDNTRNAWDVIKRGKAVVVNEQFARRAELWVGSLVQVNRDLILPIAAVVGDYGNPRGQIIITARIFKDLYPNLYASTFGVRTKDAALLRTQIVNKLGIQHNASISEVVITALAL